MSSLVIEPNVTEPRNFRRILDFNSDTPGDLSRHVPLHNGTSGDNCGIDVILEISPTQNDLRPSF